MNIRLLFFTLFLVTNTFFSLNCSRIITHPNSSLLNTKQNFDTNMADTDDQDIQDSLTNDDTEDNNEDDYQDEDDEFLFRQTCKKKARHFTRSLKKYTGAIIAACTSTALVYMYWHKVWLFAPKNTAQEKEKPHVKQAEKKTYEPSMVPLEQTAQEAQKRGNDRLNLAEELTQTAQP